ncbi:putative membrane protein [Microbacter margulisiae]|uniref:Putative membrane protein n=1 Tax=Microbacter margulisiae TaxID=1350067 RepID=A0A7W5DSX7_9PORP|nr:putative membrane protein [Microbacter margulisiae]
MKIMKIVRVAMIILSLIVFIVLLLSIFNIISIDKAIEKVIYGFAALSIIMLLIYNNRTKLKL